MRRDRSWLLLPFVAWVGACSDSVTAAPTADVPRDQSAVDGTAQPDVPVTPTDVVTPGDNGPDASVDDVVTPDDVVDSATTDVTKPPADVAVEDVFVEDVTLADVPVTPPDVPVTVDVPAVDAPAVDAPAVDASVPPDADPACTNGIVDACPTSGTTRCTDLNDGRPHTVVFTGLTAGINSSCEGTQSGAGRDGIVPLTLTATSDIVITATPTGGDINVITLYRPDGCGNTMREVTCMNPTRSGGGAGSVATVRAASLPPGTYWVQVAAYAGAAAIVQATVSAAAPRVAGDTCPGVPVTVDGGPATLSTMGFAPNGDWGTSCGGSNTANTDAVFSFTLTTPRDVAVEVSATGAGNVSMELSNTCGTRPASGATCQTGNPARRTYRGLAAGTYYITTTSAAPGRTLIASVTTVPTVTTSPADVCPGVTLTAGGGGTADVAALPTRIATLACVPGGNADAAFSFVAPAAGNDVIVHVSHPTAGVSVGMQLQRPCGGTAVGPCVGPGMGRTGNSYWQRYQGLTAGQTHAIVASTSATTGVLSASYVTIPTQAPVTVMGTPTCMSAQTIPAAGGVFRGNNTLSALRVGSGGITTSCGMCGPGGRTVVYRLTLTERRHVIASLTGGFDTFLWINSGDTCPGTNVMGACNDDAVGLTSQIDTTLAAGTYWVMAAGCGGTAAGDYTLDVVTLAP